MVNQVTNAWEQNAEMLYSAGQRKGSFDCFV
uniref:Uncharacterized protein n=1 Tax=Arundo donax TaxID=35708 RepID=A0A0A8Z8H8_ARUDO